MMWQGTFSSSMYNSGLVQGEVLFELQDPDVSNLKEISATLTYTGMYNNGMKRTITLRKNEDGTFSGNSMGQVIKFMLSFLNPKLITGFYSTVTPVDVGSISVSKV